MNDQENLIKLGAAVWNAWRKENPGHLVFSKPYWYKSPLPKGMAVKGGNALDFSKINLSHVDVYGAFAETLNLRGATIENSIFEEGDFSRCDFRDVVFRHTRFNKTILTNANFDGATFVNCNLNRVNLVGASFQARNYMPMIFEFARPDNLSLIETVVTMAGLSKFVVADLSGASVPAELQGILLQIKKPLLAFGDPYALFPDLEDQTHVILLEGDEIDWRDAVADRLPELDQLYADRIRQLAGRYEKAYKRRLEGSDHMAKHDRDGL